MFGAARAFGAVSCVTVGQPFWRAGDQGSQHPSSPERIQMLGSPCFRMEVESLILLNPSQPGALERACPCVGSSPNYNAG